jgi:acyl carrier protein
MNKAEIIQNVNEFLIEEFEIESDLLKPEATWKEIGIDSLDFVDIVVVVENIFGLKIKGEEMAHVKSLDAFYNFLDKKLNE